MMFNRGYTKRRVAYACAVFVIACGILSYADNAYAALSCSVTTAAACTNPSVILLRMTASNTHAELPSRSTAAYSNNVMCCSGLSGISNSCSGTFADVVDLASTSNSHVEESSFSNYTNPACLSVPSGTVTVGYQNSNCTGYDTTMGSISATTNGHIGSSTAYTLKICGSLGASTQTLTFALSDNIIGFGSLSTGAARYATGDALGSASEVEAHNFTVNTNAGSGYTVTVKGATLTAGLFTVAAIGGTNTGSSVGSEQFGLRMTATGGTGSVTSPYAAAGFAYAGTASTASQVASDSTGDSATTTFSVRYVANVANTTEPGSYSASLVYVATANF